MILLASLAKRFLSSLHVEEQGPIAFDVQLKMPSTQYSVEAIPMETLGASVFSRRCLAHTQYDVLHMPARLVFVRAQQTIYSEASIL